MMGRALLNEIREYYSIPANRKKFEKWHKAKYGEKYDWSQNTRKPKEGRA